MGRQNAAGSTGLAAGAEASIWAQACAPSSIWRFQASSSCWVAACVSMGRLLAGDPTRSDALRQPGGPRSPTPSAHAFVHARRDHAEDLERRRHVLERPVAQVLQDEMQAEP